MSRSSQRLAAIVPVAFLAVMVAWPLGAVLVRSFAGVPISDVVDVLSSRSFRSVLWFSTWQATASTLLTLMVGLPIAHVLARFDVPGRRWLRVLVVVPFVLPTVVVAAAFSALFDRVGVELERTITAILLAHVFFNIAVVVRIVGGFWERLDEREIEAARVLGASPLAAFRRITVPRLAPVVAGASTVVFLFSFTSFGVILLLGGPRRATLETEIRRFAVFRQEFDVAAVLALVQLVAVVALSILAARFQRRHIGGSVSAGVVSSRPLSVDTTVRRSYVTTVLAAAGVVIVAPMVTLVERSLWVGDQYGFTNFTRLTERSTLLPVSPGRALLTSVFFALGAALVASVVGVLAAWTIGSGGRLGRWLEVGSLIPLGVSAVTLGFGYIVGFTFFEFRRSVWLIPLAHAVIGLPFVLAALVPAVRSIDNRQRQVAATLGASPSVVKRRVDWPALRSPLFTGAGFAAAVSIGEFGATSFLARGDASFTAPLAVFRLLSQPGQVLRGQALALSVVIGIVVAAIATLLERRRQDAVSLL